MKNRTERIGNIDHSRRSNIQLIGSPEKKETKKWEDWNDQINNTKNGPKLKDMVPGQ